MGDGAAAAIPRPKSAMRRLVAFLKPADSGAAVAVALICGAGPFVAACRGYGAYLRGIWLFALWLLPGAGLLILSCWRLARRLYLLSRGRPSEARKPFWRRPDGLTALLVSWLAFFAGWGAGDLCRGIHCRRIRARCEPVLEALEEYRSEHGAYPDALAALPNIETLQADSGITIRQGRFLKDGIPLDAMDEADAIIYLEPSGYACYVPIEHRSIMSITRFYVYVRSSNDPIWRRDHIVWTWGPIEE